MAFARSTNGHGREEPPRRLRCPHPQARRAASRSRCASKPPLNQALAVRSPLPHPLALHCFPLWPPLPPAAYHPLPAARPPLPRCPPPAARPLLPLVLLHASVQRACVCHCFVPTTLTLALVTAPPPEREVASPLSWPPPSLAHGKPTLISDPRRLPPLAVRCYHWFRRTWACWTSLPPVHKSPLLLPLIFLQLFLQFLLCL